MNVYESIVIFNASLNDETTDAVIAKVGDLIASNGGEVLKTDVWGRRKMGYEINKHTRGNYVLYLHQSPPGLITKLEGAFKVNDQVIKYMNVRLEKKQRAHVLRQLESEKAAAEAAPAEETAEAPAAEEATGETA